MPSGRSTASIADRSALHASDVQAMHDALVAAGTTSVVAPIDGQFGRTCTFADPDGYRITLHDRA
jgi:predicted enzyme related to lactoylglutathione lyase